MSNILKDTRCGKSCEFSKIKIFCFDCPALMCNRCDGDIHRQIKHDVMPFENSDMKCYDKDIIMSLFDDKTLGINVFKELTRNITEQKTYNIIERSLIPESEFSTDMTNQWQCSRCTLINSNSVVKCESCQLYRVVEDHTGEYNGKLTSYMSKINKLFIELEKYEDVSFEHIVSGYISSSRQNLGLSNWYNRIYLEDMSLPIINEVINKHGHTLSTNDFQSKYDKLVQEKNNLILRIIPQSAKTKILKETNALLQPFDINKNINVSKGIDIKDEEIWKVIQKTDKYTDSQKRMLITELILPSNEKVNLLKVMLNDLELGPYLRENCPNGNVKIIHVRQTLVDQNVIKDMINFLKKECIMCGDDFSMPMMQPMLICSHEFCKACFKSWLEANIFDRYPCKWICPSCEEENDAGMDKNLFYFNLKEFLRENNCSTEVIKIFDEKLLSERLQGSPNFHWCANDKCENGFEAEGLNNKVQCPSCKTDMCVQCNREWKKEHENATCQEYEMFMLKNDPNLAKILNEIGIECPKCAMRYALAPGGCLHFDCRTCGFVFCGACYKEFTKECKEPGCTLGTAFHGHHPRNCLYFLRDNKPVELENLLKNSDYPKLINKPEKKCPFIIAEEKTLINKECSQVVYSTSGLCERHYKEYLVQFINRLKIDPADLANADALNLMLFQGIKPKLTKEKAETDEAFVVRLRKTVKTTCSFYVPKGLEVEVPKA